MSHCVRRAVGGQAVLTLPAEIDITTIDEIRRALLAAVRDSPAVLIIDMGGTRFCDSSGVQAIIDCHRRAEATRTQLRLVATAVTRILTLTGVDQLIPIYPTLEAALAGTAGAQSPGELEDDPG
ncbi:MAG TPA: STAS domain-containing protein [Streptosporangiaceae bacterium]|jgi:stage II sporulation protein AA (anti-sigma F factor antagonist)